MTYTEEEAKTKWCPFARVSSYGRESGWNRTGPHRIGDAAILAPSWSLCLGPACMAWQQTDNKTWPSAPGEPERKPEPAGYCGLAGQPNG
jgi:hypothetical protein